MYFGIDSCGRRVALICVLTLAFPLVREASAQPATTFASKQYGYSIVLPGGRASDLRAFDIARRSFHFSKN